MSFIVPISPCVHLFTLNIVFRWGGFVPMNPPPPPPTSHHTVIVTDCNMQIKQATIKVPLGNFRTQSAMMNYHN
jgi:hypothetical protein